MARPLIRRTILITGASSGLGAGMARAFAGLGRDLGLCARRLDRLEALRSELLEAHPGIRVVLRALDVNDHPRVFTVFREVRDELGSLDRVIVNAGLGKGQPIGTGRFDANLETAKTNFIAALAQCEAALEIFRARNSGHLVTIASITAVRGFARNLTTYAAAKAALASLTEGLRVELAGSPIAVTAVFPGYIRSEMNERVRRTPFIVDTATGCRALVKAIEREVGRAYVPWWPWAPFAFALRRMPVRLLGYLS